MGAVNTLEQRLARLFAQWNKEALAAHLIKLICGIDRMLSQPSQLSQPGAYQAIGRQAATAGLPSQQRQLDQRSTAVMNGQQAAAGSGMGMQQSHLSMMGMISKQAAPSGGVLSQQPALQMLSPQGAAAGQATIIQQGQQAVLGLPSYNAPKPGLAHAQCQPLVGPAGSSVCGPAPLKTAAAPVAEQRATAAHPVLETQKDSSNSAADIMQPTGSGSTQPAAPQLAALPAKACLDLKNGNEQSCMCTTPAADVPQQTPCATTAKADSIAQAPAVALAAAVAPSTPQKTAEGRAAADSHVSTTLQQPQCSVPAAASPTPPSYVHTPAIVPPSSAVSPSQTMQRSAPPSSSPIVAAPATRLTLPIPLTAPTLPSISQHMNVPRPAPVCSSSSASAAAYALLQALQRHLQRAWSPAAAAARQPTPAATAHEAGGPPVPGAAMQPPTPRATEPKRLTAPAMAPPAGLVPRLAQVPPVAVWVPPLMPAPSAAASAPQSSHPCAAKPVAAGQLSATPGRQLSAGPQLLKQQKQQHQHKYSPGTMSGTLTLAVVDIERYEATVAAACAAADGPSAALVVASAALTALGAGLPAAHCPVPWPLYLIGTRDSFRHHLHVQQSQVWLF